MREINKSNIDVNGGYWLENENTRGCVGGYKLKEN